MRYIRKYGVYTVIYGVYTVYGNPMYGSGQPYIYGVYTVFLAEKSLYIRSYTVCICGSGQPYVQPHLQAGPLLTTKIVCASTLTLNTGPYITGAHPHHPLPRAKPLLITKAVCVGLARTIYIRCIYGIFGREISEYTVIYGVYIWFWPTLSMCSNAHL